jgi:poly-gamma-glutamate capsule biosynthesis protein CapA/YwtB (metallophosphatase superfamily)
VLALVALVLTCAGATAGALRHSSHAVAAAGPGAPLAQPEAVTSPSPAPTSAPTQTPTREPDAQFTIVATGDVLLHKPVVADASVPGGYDFSRLLAPMDPWIQGADLALCHMEVPIAPAGTALSSFPIFGGPIQIAAGLKAQGWDGCSTASNHSVDRGFAGVQTTLDAFDAAGLGHVGTARTAAEQAQPQLYRLQRAGQTITVAQISATFSTNGLPVDTDKPWSVNLIDVPAMVAQAKAARAAGADLVIASVHCCTEYVTAPTARQAQLDQQLADSGVFDLVIGHHAHVPQPIAHLTGGPDGSGMWVAYGLGNYVANMDSSCCVANTDSGILLEVHVTSPAADPTTGKPAGPARVSGVEYTPITVDRLGGHQVHALTDIPQGTAHLSAAEVAARLARVEEAAGDAAQLRTTPLTPTGPPAVVVARTAG